MPWTPKATIQFANDVITASLALDPESETRAALQQISSALLTQAIAEDPTLASELVAASGPALDAAVAARDLLASTDDQVPQFVENSPWLWGTRSPRGMVDLGVDRSGRTFAAGFHPSMYMADRMSSDTAFWGLRERSGNLLPLSFGPLGLYTTSWHPNVPIPGRRVNLTDFLRRGERLPNDGKRDAQPLFQRAWDATAATVAELGPAQIVAPSGVYKLYRPINVYGKGGVGLDGGGMLDTILKPALNASAFYARIEDGGVVGPDHTDMVFTNFTVDGELQGGDGPFTNVKAFYIQRLRRARFENVTVRNIAATGFGLDFLEDCWFISCHATNCGRLITGDHSTGAGFGFATGLWATETIRMINCTSTNNRSHGAFLERAGSRLAAHPVVPGGYKPVGFMAIGCLFQGNYDGYFGSGGMNAQLIACQFLDNLYAGVNVDENTLTQVGDDYLTVIGGFARGNGLGGYDTGAGVRLRKGMGAMFLGFDISFNKYGVKLTDSLFGDLLSFAHVRVHDNTHSGMSFTSGSGPHRISLDHVDSFNNGTAGVVGDADGIVFHNRTMREPVISYVRTYDTRAVGSKTQKRGMALTGGNAWTDPRIESSNFRGNADASFVNEVAMNTTEFVTSNMI